MIKFAFSHHSTDCKLPSLDYMEAPALDMAEVVCQNSFHNRYSLHLGCGFSVLQNRWEFIDFNLQKKKTERTITTTNKTRGCKRERQFPRASVYIDLHSSVTSLWTVGFVLAAVEAYRGSFVTDYEPRFWVGSRLRIYNIMCWSDWMTKLEWTRKIYRDVQIEIDWSAGSFRSTVLRVGKPIRHILLL